MKRAMLLLMALLAFAHAALAEDFSAYAVKTNGFAIFAPNPILENGDMFFKTWSDRVGTVGDGYFWHFEWMRGGSVYRDLPYEVAVDQRWSPLEFMPVGGECYVIAQTVLQEDEEGTDRAVTAAVYRWTDAGVEQIAAIPDYGEHTEITVLGDAFSVYKRETGVMQIYRYDGTPLQTYRFEPESTVMSVFRAKDDTLYVVNSRRSAGGDGVSTVYALRNGDVLWQREYRHYIGIRWPGDGYLYVLQKESGKKYSPIHIERVDADGNVLVNTLNYGNFLSTVINFFILAFVVFMLVKGLNKLTELGEKAAHKEKEEAAPSVGGARAAAQPNMPKEAPSAQSVSSDAKPEPVRRETPKIGRNDLCPCGSGKKYKNCCGRQA